MTIAVSLLTEGASTTNTSDFVTASISPAADALLFAFVVNSRAASPTNTPTLSGNGLSWVLEQSISYDTVATPLHTLRAYRAQGAAPSAGAVTIGTTSSDNTGCAWAILQLTGVVTGGTSDVVVQSLTSAANASSDGTITFAAMGSSKNALLAAIGVDAGTSDVITAESGWTKSGDQIYVTPATGLAVKYKVGSGDLTAALILTSATNADRGSMGLEIRSRELQSVPDGTHSHSADNLSLTQHNLLSLAEAGHAHLADSFALVQHNVLVVAEAASGHTADNIVLTAHPPSTPIQVQEATHSHAADALSIVQHNLLAVSEAAHSHAADVISLVQHNLLTVAQADHAHATDPIALVQHNVLVVSEATNLHSADNLVLATESPSAPSPAVGGKPAGRHYIRRRDLFREEEEEASLLELLRL